MFDAQADLSNMLQGLMLALELKPSSIWPQ